MKKLFFVLIALFMGISAQAQFTTFTPDAATSASQNNDKQKVKKSKKSKDKTEVKETESIKPAKEEKPEKVLVCKIEPKYGIGSCPVVDGKIEWDTTIVCRGLSAQEIYDCAIKFLYPYTKEKNKDENSKIAVINPSTHEIGARIGEYIVFQSSLISLDRAMLFYSLCLYCSDGKCKVEMKSLSYKYENQSFPAEEKLLDENAINKKHTDFYHGGYRKFRVGTIDAKDALFKKLGDSINNKQ